MIRYSLACVGEHEFEAWFSNSAAYDTQRKKKLLECPVCGSHDVRKQIMAPAIRDSGSKSGRRQSEEATAAKMAGDYWPEPPRQSRIPMIAGAMAALLFLVAFFGAREAAVAALPDLAGLYRAIGLPVNLDGFAIEAVGADVELAAFEPAHPPGGHVLAEHVIPLLLPG